MKKLMFSATMEFNSNIHADLQKLMGKYEQCVHFPYDTESDDFRFTSISQLEDGTIIDVYTHKVGSFMVEVYTIEDGEIIDKGIMTIQDSVTLIPNDHHLNMLGMYGIFNE